MQIFFIHRRLQRQIETMKLQKDPLADKVVERISLSENEKETYNDSKLNNSLTNNNNQVYRYFSRSANVDSHLFNYKKYFSDIMLEHDYSLKDHLLDESTRLSQNRIALEPPPVKATPKIDSCSSCSTHAECIRCHKPLLFCTKCNGENDKLSPEVTNQLENDETCDLPFSNKQQVVVYRQSDGLTPYSFNVEPGSQFYKDALEDLKLFSEMKMSNYIKLYGDLRKQKQEERLKFLERQARQTGAIPKLKPEIDKISRRVSREMCSLYD